MATSPTFAERVRGRMPTVKQLGAAATILARATGTDTTAALHDALLAGIPDDAPPLSERLDRNGLNEAKLFGAIASALNAKKIDGDYSQDGADHAIRLKATRTGLELRGLLSSRGGVHVQSAGNCQVNVGLSWQPSPSSDASSLLPSNDTRTVTQSQSSPSTTTSTSEGTGIGRGGATRGRSTAKTGGSSNGAQVAIPISEMSTSQLSKYCTVEQRRAELLRRQDKRRRKNPNVRKLVGRNHRGRKGGDGCKSGKCGRCNHCRLEKRRIGTGDDGRPVYAK